MCVADKMELSYYKQLFIEGNPMRFSKLSVSSTRGISVGLWQISKHYTKNQLHHVSELNSYKDIEICIYRFQTMLEPNEHRNSSKN